MNIRTISLLCIISLFSFVGCSDDKPAVTLAVTDCPKADIAMAPTVSVTGSSRRWIVTVEVNVSCNGTAVHGAEIKVKYPWLPAFKIDTDLQGNAKVNRQSQQDPRPSGSIEVTITGSDGSRSQSAAY